MPVVKLEPLCPLCLRQRKKSVKLKVLRMNFSQGVVVCPSKNCPYPFVKDGIDKFVDFKDTPEIDLSVLEETENSWTHVLEQINKINPVKDSSDILQADEVTNDLINENVLEEFSSNFIDSFVKECELKYNKSNDNSIETVCYDFENTSLSASVLESDLNMSLLSLSTSQGELINALDVLTDLDCFEDLGRQTKPTESEENNPSKTSNVIFEGNVSVVDSNSKSNENESYIDIINKATIILEMPNNVIGNLNEQQNNSQVEPVDCVKDNLLISSDASSNDDVIGKSNEQQNNSKVELVNCVSDNSLNSSVASSDEAVTNDLFRTVTYKELKYKTHKLPCASINPFSETTSGNKSSETINISNVIIKDDFSTKKLTVVKNTSNNQPIRCEELGSVCLAEETQISSSASPFSENLPNSGIANETEMGKSMLDVVSESSSLITTSEQNDTASAAKQDQLSNAKDLSKSKEKHLLDTCLQVVDTNPDELAAHTVSGQEDTILNNNVESSTKIDGFRFLTLNEVTEDTENSSSKNPSKVEEKHTKLSSRKEISSSKCEDLSDFIDTLPLSERHKGNDARVNVTSSSTQKKDSPKTNNVKTEKLESYSPEVPVKWQMLTRSASKKKQGMPNNLDVSNNQNNTECPKTSLISSNIDCTNTDKSHVTVDLPLPDTVVSSGSPFTTEQSNFSLFLDDSELSPKKKLPRIKTKLGSVSGVRKISTHGMEDDFVHRKTRCSGRRFSTIIKSDSPNTETSSTCLNSCKSEKLEACDLLPIIYNIEDDTLIKPDMEMIKKEDVKHTVKKEPDDTFKHSDYTYNKNCYQSAKAIKQKKSVSVHQASVS